MQLYLFNIRPKLHHRQWRKLRVTLPVNVMPSVKRTNHLHQQPADAVLRPTFIRKVCYKLPSVVTFTFIYRFVIDKILLLLLMNSNSSSVDLQNVYQVLS